MNANLTQNELQAIKERVEKADKGEWYCGVNNSVNARKDDYNWKITEAMSKENAEFIAASRQDIPKLVAEVERLYAFIDELMYHVDSPRTTSDMLYDELHRYKNGGDDD